MQFLVSPAAEEDIDLIWRYLLSQAGLATANRIQSELIEALEALADSPGMGHRRADLTSGTYFSIASTNI
jgi:plasmid stabilization system protein ParE